MSDSIGEPCAAPKGEFSPRLNVLPRDICAPLDARAFDYEFDPVHRQAAIENALSMALHYLRRPDIRPEITARNLRAAVGRVSTALLLMSAALADVDAAGRA